VEIVTAPRKCICLLILRQVYHDQSPKGCFSTVILPQCSHPELVSGSVGEDDFVERGTVASLAMTSTGVKFLDSGVE